MLQVKRWTWLMQITYLSVLAWQAVWLGMLPGPYGPQNWWLAITACLLPLLPLHGILKARHRSMIYGGVILILYFTIAVTEIWTAPGHRWAGSFQVLLVLVYIIAFRVRIKAVAMAQEPS